ncbi:hypothetical protein EOA27_06025 [Mesorhizobium sp. M2A.F.Ca.ET.037.01.1.1]|uniref:hypothetical protein n=1 Tax=unclassified Mesorhizobium TaxID=325217 RepID=UPI000FCC8417|nr:MULTISPECIES: hypothetical protein [unclassified Mesorhizobium]RUY12201.1 hypothetical protein EOA25_03985 [Mesorhizobium sp. M2A.F.Ca.ET.040.01.1.1]RUX21431.1 hypothetical protein EOA27_06025 [Mesorhizobium sp. M2A.F.Ca.ET.037.01.1.1]RWA90955.1 MAG: hypothetical protein EOQ31_12200 [Mesorhizobium sp.]TIV19796.1 MAG: hypothetical protein E5V95_07140 [Mesorhizobium sp.]TIV42756.1 MAG: hypothetical protein E5V76_00100 [Mesorhizobium sp.]
MSTIFRSLFVRDDPVLVIDRPCGFGKTTKMIQSFRSDRRYLVITPLLSEVERIIEKSEVPFDQPDDEGRSKRDSLRELLSSGKNVATTHALYTDIVALANDGLLDGYDIIIDEVPEVCRAINGGKIKSFQRLYVETGYATVDPDTYRVTATEKWHDEAHDVNDTLRENLYRLASARTLFLIDGVFFMWALPETLLHVGRSFTVYTFMAEGSMLLAYLRKIGIAYTLDEDAEANEAFRLKARELITIEKIPSLHGVSLSYTGQTTSVDGRRVSNALRGLRRYDLGDDLSGVLVTCAKSSWYLNGLDNDDVKQGRPAKPGPYASGSRMFDGATWLANTTRGTNDYIDKSTLVYLWDQHINPYVNRWLGIGRDGVEQDQYALTELIQWVYRSRIRRGEKITVYLPSYRMRSILEDYLTGEDNSRMRNRAVKSRADYYKRTRSAA